MKTSGNWLPNTVNVLNPAELYTQKPFRWEILCYFYFAMIKKKKHPRGASDLKEALQRPLIPQFFFEILESHTLQLHSDRVSSLLCGR